MTLRFQGPFTLTADKPLLKPNLSERTQHAIIHSSDLAPHEHIYHAANGTIVTENLDQRSKVRCEQSGPEGDLGALLRIKYSKIYTVENYVRVLNIGMVEDEWVPSLIRNSFVKPRDRPIERPRKPFESKSPYSDGHRSTDK